MAPSRRAAKENSPLPDPDIVEIANVREISDDYTIPVFKPVNQ